MSDLRVSVGLTAKRDQAETTLRDAEQRDRRPLRPASRPQPGGAGQGQPGAREAREAAERAAKDLEQARAAADRAEQRLRPVADHERRRAGWAERTQADRAREQAVTGELATRKRLGARALELDPPAWLESEIGRPTVEGTGPAASVADRGRADRRLPRPIQGAGSGEGPRRRAAQGTRAPQRVEEGHGGRGPGPG